MRLKNKVAIITGAASGIGLATIELFAKTGAIVIALDINSELLKKEVNNINLKLGLNDNFSLDDELCNFDFANSSKSFDNYKNQNDIDNKSQNDIVNITNSNNDIQTSQGCIYFKTFDASLENNWIDIIEIIKQKFNSKLDILFNNAGITGFEFGQQDPENITLDAWNKIHNVNLNSVFLGCKYAISLMKYSGTYCSIINMSSRSGLVGIPLACAYASSKAAILNHTKSVALYCASQNYKIRVNNLCPAAILTPMWDPMLGNEPEQRKENLKAIEKDIPIKRIGQPIEVAYTALFLASDESSYITGSSINIDGGILAGATVPPQNKTILEN
ncbi:MAG: SDR family oxidoreductase [Rickettsiales bacterium]